MAPQTVRIALKNNIVYPVEILNGEMERIGQQIADKRDEIKSLNSHLTTAISELDNLQQQFIALYIQQMGAFPNISGNGGNLNSGYDSS